MWFLATYFSWPQFSSNLFSSKLYQLNHHCQFKALTEILTQDSTVHETWNPTQLIWRHNLPVKPDEIVEIFLISVSIMLPHLRQLVSQQAAGVLAYCDWLLWTFILYYEYWTVNGYLKMFNHHLEKTLHKQRQIFEGTKVSFHRERDSSFRAQRITIWTWKILCWAFCWGIKMQAFRTFLCAEGGEGCMWKNFFVVTTKVTKVGLLKWSYSSKKIKNQSFFWIHEWWSSRNGRRPSRGSCGYAERARKQQRMLLGDGLLECKLPFTTGPGTSETERAEGLLGRWALVIQWGLLRVLKRWGKRPTTIGQDLIIPTMLKLEANLFPNISRFFFPNLKGALYVCM